MAGINLFTSNRMEVLAEALAEVLRAVPAMPLEREIIVVQSRGMERWLSMELARHHGIAANYAFPFPNAFVRDLYLKVFPEAPERSPFDPDILTWRIMNRIPDLISQPAFESLRNYLGQSGEGLKQFQLSERIADLFDQYLLFRPEMIGRWEKGQGTHWQALLWRDLVRGHEGEHRAALTEAFLRRIDASREVPGDFPARVSVFGISALPRFHVGILSALSPYTDINLFLMNPCREYWGDILTGWEMNRRMAGEKSGRTNGKDLHLERGNSLLASMGTLGRDFFDVIQELETREIPLFVDSGDDSLLACLQSDILNLRERGPEEKKTLADEDQSLQIHSCHSPMREMEVLQDRILDLFDRYEDLSPGDILVMCPDIEAYAAYIQAVFDISREDKRWIPFTVADRSIRHESGVIDTFMAVLELQGGRFGASHVLSILESAPVQRRFGIDEEDLGQIRQWVADTGIRWGIDEKTRQAFGLPAFRENTWVAGLERLLLGYALPGGEERMFGHILPYDQVEGTQARLLGAFLDFTSRLFEQVTALEMERTPADWGKVLSGILDTFFLTDEHSEKEIQAVREVINALEEGAASDVFEYRHKVSLPLVKWHLGQSFERRGFGFGFLFGGLTFCAMLPMRSIPFRVICLVGMNGDAYPRQSHPPGFDLMATGPRPGDRSRRDDDRYLFLEALLSARDNFYISYVGQDSRDNASLPPSVLVSEILDYVEQGFETDKRGLRNGIVTRHRLQAFNPAYFNDSRTHFSFSEENCKVARCLISSPREPVPFISGGLSEPELSWKKVDLEDLAGFFANPARYLLTKRLGMHLEERGAVLEEKEAFDLSGLERYLLESRLVEKKLSGRNILEAIFPTRASGGLPHGSVGDVVYGRTVRGIEAFAEKLLPLKAADILEPLELDVTVSGYRIKGCIEPVYRERLLHYRYARLKPKDFIRLWIFHLALNMAGGEGYPTDSMLVGLDPGNKREAAWTAWDFDPPKESEKILSSILETYREGLIRPLHFFPDTAWTLAREVVEKKKKPQEAFGIVQKSWEGGDFSRGEGEDPYYRLCFKNEAPLDEDFQRLALMIFRPLLACRKKRD